jgi:uncharacterized sulfatase
MARSTMMTSCLRLLWVLCLAWSFTAQAQKPNIVLILSDDQAWTDYGFMGHPKIKTPHLDKLAKESLTFTRGYVPSSLCCPSLASVITGLYPHQHKITSNDPPMPPGMKPRQFQASAAFKEGRDRANRYMDALPTLPKLLVKDGYLALQTGKWWQGDFKHGGFTHGMTKGGRHGDAGLDIGRKTMQPIYDFIGEAKQAQKPFFVWYAPMMPHDPHTPPQALLDKYLKIQPNEHLAKYWAMVEWFDQTCGDLMQHLEQQDLSENTIIVYVTDNGWIQDPTKPKYAPKSKQSPYDGGLRTPIMVKWPAKLKPAMIDTPVSSLDIYPTVLKLVGIEAPKTPGIDLTDPAAVAARKTVYGECFTHNYVDMDVPATSLRWRWVLEGGQKLIVPGVNEPDAKVELYDVLADPTEEKNLATDQPEIVKALSAKLDAWWPGK